ncbi:hypothetical protein FA13DRAFT_1126484 [Coprinellus micaceus]|uniref:Uncharacterized protein n=1 Tax=Coprinellus micaceus TaxID=71717 RepID=A0A4Y7RJX6_COPMI|nr:hypothetical protein FA13DRAFT_1126484 [Coprinellus micaceus]
MSVANQLWCTIWLIDIQAPGRLSRVLYEAQHLDPEAFARFGIQLVRGLHRFFPRFMPGLTLVEYSPELLNKSTQTLMYVLEVAMSLQYVRFLAFDLPRTMAPSVG